MEQSQNQPTISQSGPSKGSNQLSGMIISIILSITASIIVVFIWELFLGDPGEMASIKDRLNKLEVDMEDVSARTRGIKLLEKE